MQEYQQEIEEALEETLKKLEKYINRLDDLKAEMVDSIGFFKGIDLNLSEEIDETKKVKELVALLIRANAVAALSNIQSFLNSVDFIKESLDEVVKELSEIKTKIK